jgi:glycosyltransferase involved in cell wall biosynthesis
MAQADLSVSVVFVSSHAKAGGAERYLETLAEKLGPPWVRSVVCLEEGPLVERLRSAGVPTEVLPTSPRAWGIAGSARRLRRLLARERPAVVHANGIKAALVCVLATRRPVVWLKHDFSFDGPLARLVASRCRLVVGVSDAVTRTFSAGARRRKVDVVHNGLAQRSVDREAGRRRLEDALGGPAGDVVALVGRLDPVKGHRELLAVASTIRSRRPELRLVFIGGPDASHGAYEDELRREAGEEAFFLGQRDDAETLIAGCDLLVIPTVVREGFPYVGLEAMAVGTPVVGYAHGGVPELVGPCGALVAPGDRDALAGEITRLLGDRPARESLAACGRERVAREFSLERMVEAMKDRYRRAAGN